MKVMVAMMSHETNTFSPVPTLLERFGNGRAPAEGKAAHRQLKGKSATMSGLLDVADERGAEIITPIAAGAPPSGPVDNEAYEYIVSKICESAAGCDAVLLDLHGAMVTESHEDGEGYLLAKLREQNPGMPIAVGLDMHANLYPGMVENSTVITGYQTYPHIDNYATGVRAANVLFDALEGKVSPTMAWGNAPMLPHVMRQGTDDFPNKELQRRVIELEDTEANGFFVPTIGLDYLYKISPRWEVGTMMDFELDNYLVVDQELERENAFIITAVGLYRLLPHLSIFAGAGVEFEHNKNLAIFRVGIDCPFQLGKRWVLVPSFAYDLKEDYNTWSLKVSFGKEF